MMKPGWIALGAVVGLPQLIVAQGKRIESVVSAMPRTYVQATCDIKNGHFLVSSAATYLKSAGEAKDAVKRNDMLEKGVEVATRAITESNQAGNGAAWYYLGRNSLQLGDVTQADSAFTKAIALIPECAEDINTWRKRAWLSMAMPATKYFQEGKSDSALALFRAADAIYRGSPVGYYNMGVIFAEGTQVDSAIYYFERAKKVAETDLKEFSKDRDAATFNLAAMYQRNNQHDKAIPELEQYISWQPGEQDAKRALVSSLRAVGRAADAAKVEKELVASAEASGTVNSSDLMSIGINQFNEKQYAEAAKSFERVLTIEPNNHDALYNLANSYLALQEGVKLESVARRLVAQEPLSDGNRRLLAQGFNLQQEQDSLMAAVTGLMAEPTSVSISTFLLRSEGATLTGQAVGKKAEKDGKPVAAAARTIVIEFVGKDGSVLDSKEVAIPALIEAQTFDWKAESTTAGIAGWRYRVK